MFEHINIATYCYDMGYTMTAGTMRELKNAVSDGIAFAWHGGR